MTDFVIVETTGTPDIISVDDGTIVVTEVPVAAEIITVGTQGPVGPQGPASLTVISAAQDSDMTDLTDGSVLIYNETTQKWTAATLLEQQTMNGGFF